MKHISLVLVFALGACGGESPTDMGDIASTDTADHDALEFERASPFRATPRTPLVEIERWRPATPEVQVAPLGTTRCGDLDVHDLSDRRRKLPDGNFRLTAAPTARNFSEVCPQSLETLTRGPEVNTSFTAPTAGRYTFEARGVTHLYALDRCAADAEPVQCASIPHYHSPDFSSAPRRISMNLGAGQTVYLILDSMNASSMTITAHTPFEEGQHCVVDTNGWIQRACHGDLWCDSQNAVPEQRVCRQREVPTVDTAWVGITGDAVHVVATGSDADANTNGMLVELFSDDDEPLLLGRGDQAQLRVNVVPDTMIGAQRFALSGLMSDLDPAVLRLAVWARVTATDTTGSVSDGFETNVGERQERGAGEYCDPFRIEDYCQAGYGCLASPRSDPQCAAWQGTALLSENIVTFEGLADAFAPDTSSLYVQYQHNRGSRTLIVHDRDLQDRRGAWHVKNKWQIDDDMPDAVLMAPGHRYGGRDAAVAVLLQTPALRTDREPCDGDRLLDVCDAGLACLREGPSFLCKPITAPTILDATVYQNRGALGVEIAGADPDGDALGLRLTPVVDGARAYEHGFTPQWGEQHGTLEVDGGDFWAARSFYFYTQATEFDLVVIDAEGLESAPVRVGVSPRLEASIGEDCDLLEARALCPEGTFCDRRDTEDSYLCQEAVHACPDTWDVTPLDMREGSTLTLAGSTSGAQNNTTSSCTGEFGWVDAPERVFSFVAPRSGWYQMWVTSDAFALFDIAVRRHCTHPRVGVSELACTDDADWHQAYGQTGTQLDEGEEVFVFVERADADAVGNFEMTISW